MFDFINKSRKKKLMDPIFYINFIIKCKYDELVERGYHLPKMIKVK